MRAGASQEHTCEGPQVEWKTVDQCVNVYLTVYLCKCECEKAA